MDLVFWPASGLLLPFVRYADHLGTQLYRSTTHPGRQGAERPPPGCVLKHPSFDIMDGQQSWY